MSKTETDVNGVESLQQFKDSFAYGTRTDLLFKFLKDLSPDEAAQFFQELLVRLGASSDDGDLGRVIEHVVEWQARAYTPRPDAAHAGPWVYQSGPFAPLTRPVSESCVALLTSSGHFVDGDDPRPFGVAGMTQDEATRSIGEFVRSKPQLSIIPSHTPIERLRVRHGGYDIRGASADANVAFPLERMRECAREGLIGTLAPEAYSFVGAAAQTPIIKESGPEWTERLKERGVEAAVLVPV